MAKEISEQEAIATILVNQRFMRNGSPPISNALDLLPARIREEVMDDAQAVSEGLAAYRIPTGGDVARMRHALEAVLNSDMAMREEDEGRESKVLNLVRAALEAGATTQ